MVEDIQTLSLSHGNREAVFEGPLAQLHQIQVNEKENNEESIIVNKKSIVRSTSTNSNNNKIV